MAKTLITNLKQSPYVITCAMAPDYELDLAAISGDDSYDQELVFILEQAANLNLKITGFGELFIKLCLKIEIIGTNSKAKVSSALFLSQNSRVSINVLQNHLVLNGESWVQVKTVLDDLASFDYAGQIFIDKNASNTIAHQENKNLVLSQGVLVKSVPSIQVLNTEVSCGHGSAIGGLDQDQLIYLSCRGLSQPVAKKVLIESFLGINL